MSKPRKFGVYLPEDLASDLEKCMRVTGIRSRSAVVREALRLFVAEHSWEAAGRAAGIIGVLYDHTARGVDEELTEIQHQYLDEIVATVHVHLTKKECMLAIIVRGNVPRLKELVSRIESIRGVMLVRPMILEKV